MFENQPVLHTYPIEDEEGWAVTISYQGKLSIIGEVMPVEEGQYMWVFLSYRGDNVRGITNSRATAVTAIYNRYVHYKRMLRTYRGIIGDRYSIGQIMACSTGEAIQLLEKHAAQISCPVLTDLWKKEHTIEMWVPASKKWVPVG